MKYSIDASESHCNIAIGICSDCGARFIAMSRLGALERLAMHEKDRHADTGKGARDALRKKRRAASK